MKYNPYLQVIQGIERWASPADKRYEKRRRHRAFRRLSKKALREEMDYGEMFYPVADRYVYVKGWWLM